MSMLLLLAVPQGATQLSFTTQPSAVNAGATMSSVVVKALTAGGVVDTGFTGTVALTTPGGATLGGTVAVAAVAGVATFSDLEVDVPFYGTLTATADGLTSAVSSAFLVYVGAPAVAVSTLAANAEFLRKTSFTSTQAPLSVAGWFRKKANSGNNGAVFALTNGGSSHLWWRQDGSGNDSIQTGHGSNFALSIGALAINTWHFIYAELTTGKIRASVNGGAMLEATGTIISTAAANFEIAQNNHYAVRASVLANSVGVWARVLTDAEIAFLRNGADGVAYADLGVAGSDGASLKTSLRAWYDLDEVSDGSGAVQRDDSHSGAMHLTDNGTCPSGDGVNA